MMFQPGRIVIPPASPGAPAPPVHGAPAGRDWGGPGRLHLAYVALGIFFYSGAQIDLEGTGTQGEIGSVNPFSTVIQLTLLLGGMALALRYHRRCLAVLPRLWPILLLLAVIGLSVLWSAQPASTMRRSVSALGLTLYLVTTCATFGAQRFMRLVLLTLVGTAIAGLAEAVLRPQVGMDVGDYANAVRGLYYQKNAQGMALFGAALALCYLVLDRGRILARDLAFVAFLLVTLVLSRSTTSLLLTMLAFGLTALVFLFERGGAWRLLAVTGMVMALLLLLPLPAALTVEDLFDLIGKDASLTGRTFIWEEAWKAVQNRPLLGYGYSAFWVADSDRVRAIQRVVDWNVPTAHSGYLDVMLQLGWLGLAVLLVMLGCTLYRTARGMARPPRHVAFWMVIFVLLQAVLSNNESSLLLLDLNLVMWMFVTYVLATPAPAPAPAQAPALAPALGRSLQAGPAVLVPQGAKLSPPEPIMLRRRREVPF
ncbi:O-antigen ligase family protein [Roseomonas sp. SSH11]|uniref:O-antigen ligase family protein n=1 Tax=Pararoseomonas baculiformis TaxID=2820812 RepID=A0ABS4A9Q3_9PROT|nr:O-antigen ligase [Pararoseomonas baculiformis]MBP0443320.1 O-antigen ligase family protein [Pararoseomonas baculiformis]